MSLRKTFLLLVLGLTLLLATIGCCATLQTATPPAPTLTAPADAEFDYDLTTPRKIAKVTLRGEITEESAKTLIFILLNPPAGAEGLVIEIDSVGGSLDVSNQIAKAVERSKIPVACVVDDLAASGAYYVLQSCHMRTMTGRATLMMHDAYQANDKLKDMSEAEQAETQAYLKAANDGLAFQNCRRLTIDAADCRKHYDGHDWYLNAADAVGVGAVDFVVGSTEEVVQGLRNSNP